MKGFKEKTFSDRLQEAAERKKGGAGAVPRPAGADDPEVLKRREERLRIAQAREERAAVRKAQKEAEAAARAEQEAIERAEREARERREAIEKADPRRGRGGRAQGRARRPLRRPQGAPGQEE